MFTALKKKNSSQVVDNFIRKILKNNFYTKMFILTEFIVCSQQRDRTYLIIMTENLKQVEIQPALQSAVTTNKHEKLLKLIKRISVST